MRPATVPRALLVAAIAVAGAAAVDPGATGASASTADIVLTDVGNGFVLVGDDPGTGGSVTRVFRNGEDELTIVAFAVTDPPGPRALFDALAASSFGLVEVPERAFELAAWLVREGGAPGDSGLSALVVASRDHIFSFTLLQRDPAVLDGPGFVLELAARQVAQAGGEPPPDTPSERDVDDEELLRYLPQQPPPGYGLELGTTLAGANELDGADLQNRDVVEFLNDRSKNVARVWVSGELAVAVGVTQYPYDIFAAAGLQTFADEPAPANLPGVAVPPGSFLLADAAAGEVGLIFRRGDLLVTVLADYRGAETEERAWSAASETALAVTALLPDGDSSPYEFPSPPSRLAGLGLTAGVVVAAVGGSRGIARLRARRVRRRWATHVTPAADAGSGTAPVAGAPLPPPAPAGHVVALDDDAARLRRRGAVVAAIQLLTVTVGVVALAGDFAWPGVAVAGLSMLTGLLFTRVWLRREHDLLGPKAPPRAFRAPRFWGAVVGLAAFSVLGIGVSFLLKGLRYVIFSPTLAQLRWSDFFGIAPRTVGVVFALGGLVVTALGAILYRVARALSRAGVQAVLASDPRPPALYLRSFSDDSLPLPVIASARRPLFELFSIRGADPFEESVAWELDSYGPVVAVGRPGGSLASLGAAREHLPADGWHAIVADRMNDAGVIVLAPGETPGVVWELDEIQSAGHLGKTVFVFPPVAPGELERRWAHTAGVLRAAGARVGDLPAPPGVVHTARIDEGGAVHVTIAATRDEATYRTAVDRALEPLAADITRRLLATT